MKFSGFFFLNIRNWIRATSISLVQTAIAPKRTDMQIPQKENLYFVLLY